MSDAHVSSASRRRVAVVVGLWLSALIATAASGATRVEFLYADASEGSASGGHVALRLDDRVYHYQRDADGLLVLSRDAWQDFAFQYRAVENRNLFASEIAVAEETAARLRDHFDRRFVAENAERQHLVALRNDVALLDALTDPDHPGFALRGAGFFARDRKPSGRSERAARAAFASLHRKLETNPGASFLAKRRRAADASLRAAALPFATSEPDRSALDAYPFSERVADAHAARLALDVLHDAPPLRHGVRRVLPGVLDATARASLRERRRAIEASLAELVGSPRPDWGFAFLLGAARLALTIESLERNRMVVLDVGPASDAPRLPFDGAPEALAAHLSWRGERLATALRAYLANPGDERALSALEREAALHAELVAAFEARALPRRLPANLVPEGRALVRPLPRLGFDAETGVALRRRAEERLARAEETSRRERDYDLIERNCVTELFAQIDAATDDATLPAVGAAPLTFVPFVADRTVAAHWPGAHRRILPSRRTAARAEESGWIARLRESNTITSTLYTPHAGDSIFLFFTDDAGFARPLLGAANVVTGVIASGAGLAWAPLDRGVLFGRGLRGVTASLPELAFFNIRKGTFPLALPPRKMRADGDARSTR